MRYVDPTTAIEFLTKGLGFVLHARFDDPRGNVMHAELFRGNGIIMVGPHPADGESGADLKPGISSTCIIVDGDSDVDAVFTCAVTHGATALPGREPKDMPYGGRSASICDLDGHLWHIGSYKPQPTALS